MGQRFFIYFLFLFNLFLIIFFWWSNSAPLLTTGLGNALIGFGRLFGLFAVYFVLIQFLLIGRSFWIEKTFGLDKLSRVHHLNGYFSIGFIVLHPIFITVGYSLTTKQNVLQQFLILLNIYEDVLQAFLGASLFVLIVFFSVYIVRKRLKYETWYFIHLFMYLAIFLAWGHQLKNGGDFLANNLFVNYWYGLYLFVFGNHLVFRFFKPFYLFKKHNFFVEKIVGETGTATSVYITGKNIKDFKINPGQFMILRFLTKDFWWQAHPFSLSKLPDGKSLRVTIKNVGNFTAKIQELKPGTSIVIDGPLGIFTKRANNKVLLIAGGIGITPIRSLLEQMAKNKKDIVLLYSNKRKSDIVFKKEIDELKKKYGFLVYYFLSQEKDKNFLQGRIDKEKIRKLVKDISKRDVYICGPVVMMDSLKKDLLDLKVPPSAIYYEKFSL